MLKFLLLIQFSASSLTAMETWVIACLVFVFLALIEYGVVLKIQASKTEKDEDPKQQIRIGKRTVMAATVDIWQKQNKQKNRSASNNG